MKILSMKTTIFLGAMLSLLVCLMFTGCSNSETNSTSRGLTDFAHIEEEYLATIDSLNWPDGITLPDKLEDEDTGASFQVGYGETRASYLWEYSWMKEWLDTYNTSGAREAIFINCLSRSSRATCPKIRVPLGVLSSLMITAAFSSNLM